LPADVHPWIGAAVKLDTAPPRGMKDVLPPEVELRDRTSATILATYKRYGFRRIETPALENLKLLLGSGGGENEKLIYKILKRGAKLDTATMHGEEDLADLGLRFDLTVPLARYYAHNRATLPDPFKAIQIGPVWRAERPQKGRFRQFTQCDIDILGVASEIAEIELILATAEALIGLGLERPTIRLNDRRILAAIAEHCGFDADRQNDFFVTLDKLDKIGREGVERELRDEEIQLDERYHAGTYGIPDSATLDAMRLAARTEGMVTDPVYEGKSMAGLIDLVTRGEIHRDATVLYAHLGGQPALNAYSALFS